MLTHSLACRGAGWGACCSRSRCVHGRAGALESNSWGAVCSRHCAPGHTLQASPLSLPSVGSHCASRVWQCSARCHPEPLTQAAIARIWVLPF